MSLLAGYFSKKKNSISAVNALHSFLPLESDNPSDYKMAVIPFKHGAILWKAKADYPSVKPKVSRPDGNITARLGEAGEFVDIRVEGRHGNVVIRNDRFAARAYYILESNDVVYFSSDLRFLLALAGPQPRDPVAWMQLWSLGYILGTATPFKTVRRLAPATNLTITEAGLGERQYWKFEHDPQDVDPTAHAEHAFAALVDSCRGRAPGVVTLTGGSDSRLTAAALSKAGVKMEALTWIPAPTPGKLKEAETAARVAKSLGIPHFAEHIPQDDFSQLSRNCLRLTSAGQEGASPFLFGASWAKARGYSHLYHAAPGDCLSGGYSYSAMNILADAGVDPCKMLEPGELDRCTAAYCKGEVDNAMRKFGLLRMDLVAEYGQMFRRAFVRSFENLPGPTFVHRIAAWGMTQKLTSSQFCYPTRNHPGIVDAIPILSYPFVDAMLKLSAEQLLGRSFYVNMIRQCVDKSEFSNSSASSAGIPMKPPTPAWKRMARVVKRSIPQLFPKSAAAKPYWYTFAREDGMDMRETRQLLPLLTSMVDAGSASSFLDDMDAGITRDGYDQDYSTFSNLFMMASQMNALEECRTPPANQQALSAAA